MDVSKVIAELREQRESLDQAIFCLERLELFRPRRRGRPSKRLSALLAEGLIAHPMHSAGRPSKAAGTASGS